MTRRPRLDVAALERAAELPALELGARAALAVEFEHARPGLVQDRIRLAAQIRRARRAAAIREAIRAARGRGGVVYLLHFDRRYKHAGHYTGWTQDLAARLAQHGTGEGARLLAVVHEAGISWDLARTWPGPRARERQLKRQGGASRHCPLCKAAHRQLAAAPLLEVAR
jgi:predicted GIY-YIG superfamily endonuclease